MKEACNRERLKRLDYLMVMLARLYQLKRCGPAFDHYRRICQDQVEVEQNAGVIEFQRMWRGYRGRIEAISERKAKRKRNIQAEEVRVSAVIAVWGQSRYRGHASKRRAEELKKLDSKERVKKCRLEAASAIQAKLRSYQRRRVAAAVAVLAAADKYINGEPSIDTDTGSTVTAERSEGPIVTSAAGSVRGPSYPAMPAEIQAMQLLGTPDEGSLFSGSDQMFSIPRQHPSDEGPSKDGNSQRRPSSSREARGGSPPSDHTSPSSRRNSGRRRRSSSEGYTGSLGLRWEEVKTRQVVAGSATGTASVGRGVQHLCPRLIQDASRLALENEPSFKAATAIQAAWKNFVRRLALKKRRRATAALRRKREGKWRKQRGVVGKQVRNPRWDQGAV